MNAPKALDYGSWKSPITASSIAQKRVSLVEVLVDNNQVYLLEVRPKEKGRYVIVKIDPNGKATDYLADDFSARTLVYSYGGGSFNIKDEKLVFSHFALSSGEFPYAKYQDQRVFIQEPEKKPIPLTDTLNSCYADGVFDLQRNRYICVRQDNTYQLHGESLSVLVAIDLEKPGTQQLLAQGHDFYISPRISPDGSQLCWLSWNYPNMPWDGNELWLADIDSQGGLKNQRIIAGGEEESICQPQWSPDGVLYFISDRTNWWNFYCLRDGKVDIVYERPCDFAGPQWIMRSSQYDFISKDWLICSFVEEGKWKLGKLNLNSGEMEKIWSEYTEIRQVRATSDFVVFLGGNPTTPSSLIYLDLKTEKTKILKSSTTINLEELKPYISNPTQITFETGGQEEKKPSERAYAFYYPPTNPCFIGPENEKPPLIIQSHGGPTGAATTFLDLEIQFFTSRGFAVVDVNYRGSCCFGREFRLSLYKNWGIYDVEDCVKAVQYLIEEGKVDSQRVLARGGSAGGYTTLCLLTFTDLCKAGTSYFGISNLELIAQHSDKLESRYAEKLIGPYPEEIEKFKQRSPLFHAEKIKSPALFFQGEEDPIVPPEQTQVMVDSLEERKIPYTALFFPEEQHGFRIDKNIKKAFEAELYFYSQILNFEPAEDLASIEIRHWKTKGS